MPTTPSIQANSSRYDDFFKRLVWQKDRMLLDDLVFRLQHFRDDSSWDLGDQCFVYFKVKGLVDSYAKFLKTRPGFAPRHIFELGLWEGGSVPFWFELFRPAKHIGVDISDREDSPYFRKYIEDRSLQQQIKTYWRTDQSDRNRLLEIVRDDFEGNLDLVIDDASHYYSLTRASFETLFPLLRPGGLYIIEDWAWEHWPGHVDPAWPKAERLGRLVHELIGLAGSSKDIISEVIVYQGFTVAVRGEKPSKELASFNKELASFNPDNFIYRQPDPVVEPALDAHVVKLEQDRRELLEYVRKVEEDRQELLDYVRKVEQDRQLKLEEYTRVSRRLQALEHTNTVRLSRRLATLLHRARGKLKLP